MASTNLFPKKRLSEFIAWLGKDGGCFYPVLGNWEVLRFRFAGEIHYLYERKNNKDYYSVPRPTIKIVYRFLKETTGKK